ncbi:MAG: hypothetical protein AAF871_03050 [Pseudomonadota bacterium]
MKPIAIVITFAAAITISPAAAGPPDLQTPSPVIYLADNLDEADNLGWCIDTLGRGLSDQLQAHSCKPQGGDVQFSFDAATGQIRSVAFEGLCASYDGTLPLGLVDCADTAEQSFVHDEASMTLRLASDPDACLVVGAASRSAGPFMSRSLEVADCEATDALLKTWVVMP